MFVCCCLCKWTFDIHKQNGQTFGGKKILCSFGFFSTSIQIEFVNDDDDDDDYKSLRWW